MDQYSLPTLYHLCVTEHTSSLQPVWALATRHRRSCRAPEFEERDRDTPNFVEHPYHLTFGQPDIQPRTNSACVIVRYDGNFTIRLFFTSCTP